MIKLHSFLVRGALAFVLVMLTGLSLNAQPRVQYLQYEDLKPFHFGFMVGMHTQDLIMDHSGVVDADGNRWYGSVPSYMPGFSVGVIGDLRLTDYMSLRITPAIHFGSKNMRLTSDVAGVSPVESQVRSNYILIPVNLRYRGARSDNYRPYVLTGLSAGADMGRDKQEPVLLKPVNLYWEFGVGCDFYLPYFRLVPELKVCLGLGDVFVHDRTDESSDAFLKYTNAFDAITSRLLVFSLQFE